MKTGSFQILTIGGIVSDKMKGKIFFGILILLSFIVVFSNGSLGQETPSVCCEKTTSGLFCQNVPASECAAGATQAASSCESTSFCQQGYCSNPFEGTCSSSTPRFVCENNGGVWSEEFPPQCQLGCCVLGEQAAFVTQTRCKALSASLGLSTNFNSKITSEVQCILSVAGQEKGACVYDEGFEKTCKFTTRANCANVITGEFFKDTLCTAEELGANCAPTTKTACVPGRDEVHFVDTCGNPANIYDSSKTNNNAYWSEKLSKAESCNPDGANADSRTCGNCNYLLGSICRQDGTTATCVDLNCGKVDGDERTHGESWCVYEGESGNGKSSAGSRHYKKTCSNGEVLIETCAEFRQESCVQSDTKLSDTQIFSEASCKANRWQDCTSQRSKDDCENGARRDCYWIGGTTNACLPKTPPGLEFWQKDQETNSICAQANTRCTVVYEKDIFGDEDCKENCHCRTADWLNLQKQICSSLGDCGPNVNWIKEQGAGGFKVIGSG